MVNSPILAFLGRFLAVLCCTIAGTVLGVSYGIHRASLIPLPAGKSTLGMETEGVATLIVGAMYAALGGGGGLLIGLLVGIVGMVVYRSLKVDRQSKGGASGSSY